MVRREREDVAEAGRAVQVRLVLGCAEHLGDSEAEVGAESVDHDGAARILNRKVLEAEDVAVDL